MNYSKWILACLLTLFLTNQALAQAPPSNAQPHSHKYRTIFTTAGAAGGFTIGVFAGLAAFDDSTYSERKVWTTAILGGAGGGVGGYFLGRALDKRRDRANAQSQKRVVVAPVLSTDTKGVRLSIAF